MVLREKTPEVYAVQAEFASHDRHFSEAIKAGRIVDKMKQARPHVMVATPEGMLRAKPSEYIALDHNGGLRVLSQEQVEAKYERVE
jgi:hypothetical protein